MGHDLYQKPKVNEDVQWAPGAINGYLTLWIRRLWAKRCLLWPVVRARNSDGFDEENELFGYARDNEETQERKRERERSARSPPPSKRPKNDFLVTHITHRPEAKRMAPKTPQGSSRR
jgi:hypothetical protein